MCKQSQPPQRWLIQNLMRFLSSLIEIIIVILCLPFYLLVWSFIVANEAKAASRIRQRQCPNCNGLFNAINRRSLIPCGVRFRLSKGSCVDRERLPSWSITCPNCKTTICFDQQIRITSCNIGNHISHGLNNQWTLQQVALDSPIINKWY